MPPTATTSTGGGTPTVMPIDSTPTLSSGFAGEEFINNLGSDLAPLLTLFGEQVTKQFLSMSLGWADHILLAVGPLGIITTVVSAIRVSNVRVLKAIIGRAREKLATAELELLSSTSDATSELWTEEGIVRQPGHATILEMVAYKCKSTRKDPTHGEVEPLVRSETHIGDLSEAYNVGVLRPVQEGRSRGLIDLIGHLERDFWLPSSISGRSDTVKDLARIHAGILMRNAEIMAMKTELNLNAERAEVAMLTERTASDSAQELCSQEQAARKRLDGIIAGNDAVIGFARRLVKRLADQPPNLILNVHNTFPKSGELWTFVMIGIALQLVAVSIPAIMTYHWRKPKGSQPVQDYAYPTFLLGTCLLVLSIALCSYIIEATTVEQVFTPSDDYAVENIFRLQLQQNMGDQPFKAYVIVNDAEDRNIRTSRYDPEETLGHNDQRNPTVGVQDDSSESDAYGSPTSRWDRVMGWLPGVTSDSEHAADQAAKSGTKAQGSMVIIAVVLCFVGFICQFVGLRALHWSATVIQLGVTLLMTCIRAWIRRGISNQPITFQLPNSDPNWIALSLGTACRDGWPPGKKPWPTKIRPRFQLCNVLPEMRSAHVTELISNDDPRIQLRRKLQSWSTTDDSDLLPQAQALLSCMHVFVTLLEPHNKSRSRPITWSHIVESSDLNDSSVQNSRLKLTMSFDYQPFQESEQEVLNRSILHTLLSILRYGSGPTPSYRCVARVSSQEDWIRKRDFLVAQIAPATEGEDRYHMSYLSTTGHHFSYHEGHMNSRPIFEHNHSFAGTSIDDMQPATRISTAGSNPSYGYLLVAQSTTTDHVTELLAGFMDAVCHRMNPKYDHVMEKWCTNLEGEGDWIEPDYIAIRFKALQLTLTNWEVRLLVVSSLARCTVWNDSVRTDEPTPESFPLPKPSSRAAL